MALVWNLNQIKKYMHKVHYIGFYSKIDNPNNFRVFPALNTKMNYIISVLKKENCDLSILAIGETQSKNKLYKRKVFKIDEKEKITYVFTFNFGLKILSRICLLFQLFYYLVFKVKKNEIVLYYHTYLTIPVVRLSKFFNNFNLVLEVEEVYQAAWRGNQSKIEAEIEYIKEVGNSYIFVNDLISDIIKNNKPSVACYGSYNCTTINKHNTNPEDLSVNVIYAGVIAEKNTDVYLAIEAVKLLPVNYKLYILGYGIEEDVINLKNELALNNKSNIKFYGRLDGAEYIEFLSTCDIGLSTRVLEDKYSDFTFPSKILVYLSNGLKVVSSPISSVVNSKIGKTIHFYESNNPDSVAKAIIKCHQDNSKEESREILNTLDKDFSSELINIFNYLKK
jgi:hypothetical protein